MSQEEGLNDDEAPLFALPSIDDTTAAESDNGTNTGGTGLDSLGPIILSFWRKEICHQTRFSGKLFESKFSSGKFPYPGISSFLH
mmetsp:Transcript_29782/g.50308  ORF Transcript_29782/g.50308 Transcript_29782/m.50308 type:complete len:85 (+) Transcript_29782:25-279(+)